MCGRWPERGKIILSLARRIGPVRANPGPLKSFDPVRNFL